MFTMPTRNVKECEEIATAPAETCWVKASCDLAPTTFVAMCASFVRNDGKPFDDRAARVNVLAQSHFRIGAVPGSKDLCSAAEW